MTHTHARSTVFLAVVLGVASLACESAREGAPAPAPAPPSRGAEVHVQATPPGDGALDVDAMRRAAERAGLTATAPGLPGASGAPEALAPSESAPADALVPPANAPPTPRAFSASALSPTRVSLEWLPAERGAGVTTYRILRDGSAAGLVAETAFVDDGLRPGSRHCYAIFAIDAAGNRSASTRTACVDMPDRSPPTAPPALRAEARDERHVLVSWQASRDDVGVRSYEVLRADAVVGRVSDNAFTELGLAPAQTYCYSVRAVDAAGNVSAAAGPACATTPDLTPPSPPTAVAADARGERAVRVRWSPSVDDAGVAGYELLRDGKVVASTEEVAAIEEGLRPTVRYCYTVRARDAAGNRSAEGGPACATTPDLTAPTVPSEVAVTATSDTRVELRWTASTDEIGVQRYEVLRERTSLGFAEGTTHAEAGLRPGREYCYVVRAHDAAGNVSAGSARACATTPDLTPPSAPPRLAVAPNSPSNIVLAWDAATDDVAVARYEILRGGVVVARVDAPSTDWLDRGLPPASDACYAVVAMDAAGHRSPPQGIACARTADAGVPAAPRQLRAAPETVTSVALTWEPSSQPGVVYSVYWDKGGRVGSTGNTSFSAMVKGGERRCFRVAAVDVEGRESPRTFDACAAPRKEMPRETLSRADAP
jgi:chitodextrinase